jgi:hypothetical protein
MFTHICTDVKKKYSKTLVKHCIKIAEYTITLVWKLIQTLCGTCQGRKREESGKERRREISFKGDLRTKCQGIG